MFCQKEHTAVLGFPAIQRCTKMMYHMPQNDELACNQCVNQCERAHDFVNL